MIVNTLTSKLNLKGKVKPLVVSGMALALVLVALALTGRTSAQRETAASEQNEQGQQSQSRRRDNVLVRKNAATLSKKERAAFVNAVKQMTLRRSKYDPRLSAYDYFVKIHYTAFYNHGSAHKVPAFLPWHREFLRRFEEELQAVDPKVTIPYWDWTNPTETAAIFTDDFLGGNGDPADNFIVKTGPFRQGQWSLLFIDPRSNLQTCSDPNRGCIFDLQRQFGVTRPTLPTPSDVATAMNIPTYDLPPYDRSSTFAASFRNNLEGWTTKPDGTFDASANHNRVHGYIGGTMGFATSPNDPVFWMNHANIDRLWNDWQNRFGTFNYPAAGAPTGSNLYDVMTGFEDESVTPAMVMDMKELDYRYQ